MITCTQKNNQSNKNQPNKAGTYEEIRRKAEFAEKFLEALKLRNRLDSDPSLFKTPEARKEFISRYREIMVEALQVQRN